MNFFLCNRFAKSFPDIKCVAYLADLFPSTLMPILLQSLHLGVLSVTFQILQDAENVGMEPPTSRGPLVGRWRSRRDNRVRPSGYSVCSFSEGWWQEQPSWWPPDLTTFPPGFQPRGSCHGQGALRSFLSCAGLTGHTCALFPVVSCSKQDGPLLAWHQPKY